MNATTGRFSMIETEDRNILLIKEFLSCLGLSPDNTQPNSSLEVIFDMVLDDGYRYVLTRVPRCTVALSHREWEIIRLIAQGMPNKQIALVLDISQFTVATHLRRIFAKLNVNSRAEMIARAMELNLLQRLE
jgi:ATP/maltotriose-dependent transcriptional regulator MalT